MNLEEMKDRDPEMYQLMKSDQDIQHQSFELAQKFRNAPSDQKTAIKKELNAAVAKHFEVRQQRRELDLKRLEADLKRVQDSLKSRNEKKDQIIGQRMAQLLGEEAEQF